MIPMKGQTRTTVTLEQLIDLSGSGPSPPECAPSDLTHRLEVGLVVCQSSWVSLAGSDTPTTFPLTIIIPAVNPYPPYSVSHRVCRLRPHIGGKVVRRNPKPHEIIMPVEITVTPKSESAPATAPENQTAGSGRAQLTNLCALGLGVSFFCRRQTFLVLHHPALTCKNQATNNYSFGSSRFFPPSRSSQASPNAARKSPANSLVHFPFVSAHTGITSLAVI